jgi:hypothetical protein
MTSWTGGGGCINGIRYADEGGSPIDFIVAADTSAPEQPNNKTIIVTITMDSDDMCALTGDFFLEWRVDAGSWADLTATGALKWGTVSDYANGDQTPLNRFNGTENCSTMGVTPTLGGIQREGANTLTITSQGSKDLVQCEWAVDISGASAGSDYEFRISESGGGSGIYKTFTGIFVEVVQAGKIDLVTRNEDRTSVEGSVTVAAYDSDGGTPPSPINGRKFKGVSNGSGVLSVTGLVSGNDYILIGAGGSPTRSDATPAVTAVDA